MRLYAHLAGAALGGLALVVIGALVYDAAVPVQSVGASENLTPVVKRGDELVIAYPNEVIRQCATDSQTIKVIITGGRGIEYKITPSALGIMILADGRVSLAVPVPDQAATGTGYLLIEYDKICNVLGFFASRHHVALQPVAFKITE